MLTYEERWQAVNEAKQVLKQPGYIFAAFITRFAAIRDAAKRSPEWVINQLEDVEQRLTTGIYEVGDHDIADSFTQAYFAHPGEIEPFMASAGFYKLCLIGCEGIVAGNEEKVNQLSGQDWEIWVELNYRLGQDVALHGAADHLLYIGRNESATRR